MAKEISALPPGRDRESRLESLLLQWARENASDACDFIENETDRADPARWRLAYKILSMWLDHDAVAAKKYALNAIAGDNGNAELYLKALAEWEIRGDGNRHEGLKVLLASLPQTDQVFKETLGFMASVLNADPEGSRELIALYPIERYRWGLSMALGEILARKNGIGVLDALVNSSSSSDQASLSGAINQLKNSDAEGLARWFMKEAAVDSLDGHRELFVMVNNWGKPDLAMSIALTIHDPARRTKQVQSVFATWLALDEREATAWAVRGHVPESLLAPVFRGEVPLPPRTNIH